MKLLSAAAIRRTLIADPGHAILSADYDQVELRVAAGYAGEKVLIDAAKRGESLHKATAVKLFGPDYTPDQYRYTKNVNFGWLFGGGADTLSKQAGIPIDAAFNILREYESEMSAMTSYKRKRQDYIISMSLTSAELKIYKLLLRRKYAFRADTASGRAARKGVQIEIDRLLHGKYAYTTTPFGRRLLVEASKAYRVVSYEVQSAARDIMAGGLNRVMADPELEPTVLLPVHDELLGQARIEEAERIARRYSELMSTTFLGVPITADAKVYGHSWGHGYGADS